MATRPLVEGALFAAVSVVLGLVGYFVPVTALVLMAFWPVPVALVYIRHDFRTAFLTVLVTGLVLATVIGAVEALLFVLASGSMGLALGFSLRRRLSGIGTITVLDQDGQVWVMEDRRRLSGIGTITVMAGAALFSMVASGLLSYYLLGVNLLQMQDQIFEETIKGLALYERLGLSPEMVQTMRDRWLEARDAARLLLPSMAVLASFVLSYIDLAAASPIMKRFGFEPPVLPSFKEWRMPRFFAYLYLLGFLLILGKHYLPLPWLDPAGTNLVYFLSISFILQGVAVAYYFLSRWNLSKPLRVVLLVYALFIPVLAQILSWLGLFDTIIDYRRMAEERQNRG
ncbi:MAG: YybS family protein [Firmicutes bacterium]|nr:YybS family protein [Bacillota bacterium]MCL5040519.1 YybS family protein [Bacillota bacterium]